MSSPDVVQIYIPAVAGKPPASGYYQCGLQGRYRARLLGVTWGDDVTATTTDLHSISSTCFKMPYGSVSRSIMIASRIDKEHTFLGNFDFTIESVGNTMDISLSSTYAYDGTTTGKKFTYCLITMAVERLE